MKNIVILIPAYEPEPSLVALVKTFARQALAVIVVDDGSTRRSEVFASLPSSTRVILLKHETNRGKGAALKTGFREVLARFPQAVGVVTVDADGQHLPSDVQRVAAALGARSDTLTLGVRTFSTDTPFRSKLGNFWTCGEFFLLTGHIVRDTQTGLRGIPATFLPYLLQLDGDRYEYEINMLVKCLRRYGPPLQIPITTVYLNGNETSHYRPLADTLLTQKALFLSAFSRW